MDMPDKSLFKVDERANEYYVTFSIEGEIEVLVTASSEAEARDEAEDMMADDDFGEELDEVSRIQISYVRKARPMYLVTRDGQKIKTSHLQPGDMPRDPDERGF